MKEYKIVDSSSLHRYRTEIPNIIDEMNLDPYEFRLYFVIKRIAGDGGACFASNAELCRRANMKITKLKEIKKALCKPRKELNGKPLIKLKERKKSNGEWDSTLLTIVDIWPENMMHFAMQQVGRQTTDPGSPNDQPRSPNDHKEEPYKKEPYKKNPPLTPPIFKKKEEDFSSKIKNEKFDQKTKVDQVVAEWKNEGRPKHVIAAVIKAYKEQPYGSIRSISTWMETVYAQKFDSADADELYELRRQFAKKIESECVNNYFFSNQKDILCYTCGNKEIIYDIKGIKKNSEDFWIKHKLGKNSFIAYKKEQRSTYDIVGV